MKKLIQVSIVLVIAFALIVGLFQVADGSALAGIDSPPSVGTDNKSNTVKASMGTHSKPFRMNTQCFL